MDSKKNIEKLYEEYYKNLWEIDDFVFETELSYAFFQDKYKELLNIHKAEDNGMTLFTRINSKIPKHINQINVFAIINAIARTEAYLNDVLETLFNWNTNSLKSDKTLTYCELLDYKNYDEIINQLIQKEITEFSHASIDKKLLIFRKRFNLIFKEIEDNKSKIIEMFTTRNIILHNNGVVNNIYIEQNKGTDLILNSKKEINKEYLRESIEILRELGKSIHDNVLNKLNK